VSAACGAAAADVGMPQKAPPPQPRIESSWTFTITPYAWLTNLNGSSTVANQTKDIDVTFVDLMRHAEIPKDLIELSGFFEARG